VNAECSKQYIGETGRVFKVRLNEQKNSIKKGDPDISKLCEHHYYTGHLILFNFYKKILTKVMTSYLLKAQMKQ
jgi:hypothetical protein